jgi:hypothetical protein
MGYREIYKINKDFLSGFEKETINLILDNSYYTLQM